MEKIPDILTAAIEKLLNFEHTAPCIIGIDGRCCSGKTTLAAALSAEYHCDVFHADDFFLQPWQRTPERLAIPGGNLDYERLSEELLLPLSMGKPFAYRKFSCARMALEPPVSVIPGRLAVVEGSYSMHPVLRGYYHLKIFLDIDPDMQLKRLEKRENAESLQRFKDRWIPLEEKYLNAMDIKSLCDFSFSFSDL